MAEQLVEKSGKIVKLFVKKDANGLTARKNKDNGNIYYYVTVEMEDGTKGDITTNKEDEYSVEQTIRYTYEQTQFGGRIKVIKPKSFSGGGFGGGNNNYQKANPKIAIAIAAVQMANELVAQRVIEIAEAKKTAKYYFNMINELAGETAALPNPNNPK